MSNSYTDSVVPAVSAAVCARHIHVLARWYLLVIPLVLASVSQCQQEGSVFVQYLFSHLFYSHAPRHIRFSFAEHLGHSHGPITFKQRSNNSGSLLFSHSI